MTWQSTPSYIFSLINCFFQLFTSQLRFVQSLSKSISLKRWEIRFGMWTFNTIIELLKGSACKAALASESMAFQCDSTNTSGYLAENWLNNYCLSNLLSHLCTANFCCNVQGLWANSFCLSICNKLNDFILCWTLSERRDIQTGSDLYLGFRVP